MVRPPERHEPISLDAALLRSEIEASFARFGRELEAPAAFSLPSDGQIARLGRFLDILGLWRARLSLISVSDPLVILRDHVLDSLALLPWVHDNLRVADLGSGGGFPGVPLAIFRPGAELTLIESRRRRVSFLNEVARSLGLTNVRVIEARGEEVVPGLCPPFDLTVCRAFASIGETLEIAVPLTRPGGKILSMKGERSAAQANESRRTPEVHSYTLAGGEPRKLVIYTV